MLAYIWPIGLVVLSNVIYQICAKSVPLNMSPFASLTVTYAVSALLCLVLYYILDNRGCITGEYAKLNWALFVFGIVLVGLEVGFIYAYKAGWQVSTATVVESTFLAVILLMVGTAIYKEPLTFNKIIGMIICLIGLVFINK